jgi:hypothetical protein
MLKRFYRYFFLVFLKIQVVINVNGKGINCLILCNFSKICFIAGRRNIVLQLRLQCCIRLLAALQNWSCRIYCWYCYVVLFSVRWIRLRYRNTVHHVKSREFTVEEKAILANPKVIILKEPCHEMFRPSVLLSPSNRPHQARDSCPKILSNFVSNSRRFDRKFAYLLEFEMKVENIF